MTAHQNTQAPSDYVAAMNHETLNAHAEFQISVQQATRRLEWTLEQIVLRAQCAQKAAQAQIEP